MRFRYALPALLALLALTALPVWAADETAVPPQEHPVLYDIVDAVNIENLRATERKLVSFHTRHTLSSQTSDSRGIGAASRWVKSRFEEISEGCGGCLTIITPSQTFTGERSPKGVKVTDIVAIQRGTSDPGRYLVMTAHLDTRVNDVMDAKAFQPGADDDGSGIAALIETARILSQYDFAATIVYSADPGEEQGLYGGKIISDYAAAHDWNVEANLNNDMIGNTFGSDGVRDNTTARIFSQAIKLNLTDEEMRSLRLTGGFVDSPSRQVARYIKRLAEQYIPNFHFMLMYRRDRYNRGGDQIMFYKNGFPAVRINEAHENWRHQHQYVRKENGIQYGDLMKFVDFEYLGKMTAANAIALASMAWAPAPPSGVEISGSLSPDTTVSWEALPAESNPQLAGYRIYWRRTSAPMWQHSRYVGNVTEFTLEDIVIDNWYFGVSAVSEKGFESPVVFPGKASSF